ncbi:hypothetical protein Ctob_013561, partial [Chrysochromulina tobinii]
TAPSLNTAPTPTAAGVPKTAHDAPKTARRTIKVAWARRWLEARLVGLACHAGHGEDEGTIQTGYLMTSAGDSKAWPAIEAWPVRTVALRALTNLRGEAHVCDSVPRRGAAPNTAPKLTRAFDLAFDLEWMAKLSV